MRILQLVLIVHQLEAIPNLLALRLMGCRTNVYRDGRVPRRSQWQGRSLIEVTDIYVLISFLTNYCEYNVLPKGQDYILQPLHKFMPVTFPAKKSILLQKNARNSTTRRNPSFPWYTVI